MADRKRASLRTDEAEVERTGPILEEDIAFSSIAQDELGHALVFYRLLEELGEGDPDALAFGRPPSAFRNASLVEQPRGDYAYSLLRQFLFDAAEAVRLEALAGSTYRPLAEAAAKIRPEERYHLMHGASFIRRLAGAGAEAGRRLQAALEETFPGALGLFEPIEGEEALAEAGIAPTQADLERRWLAEAARLLEGTGLRLPAEPGAPGGWRPAGSTVGGGRRGEHTPHLTALLDAMQAVYRSDPSAKW
jgi:ring-1,2-phenylacetyl-CoA epoxidase subunit PaaC